MPASCQPPRCFLREGFPEFPYSLLAKLRRDTHHQEALERSDPRLNSSQAEVHTSFLN